MRSKFASAAGWHYTSPEGIQPDLHHALLSRDLGGGIAYLGQICNSDYGFGLSTTLSGDYASMGSAVVWDMMVVSRMWSGFKSPVSCLCDFFDQMILSFSSCTSLDTTLVLVTPMMFGHQVILGGTRPKLILAELHAPPNLIRSSP